MTEANVTTVAAQKTVSPAKKEEHVSNVPEAFKHLFLMFYRHGMNAALSKGFYHEGDIQSARKRAEKHCKIMGYHFIFVRPMVCDIVLEEEYKLTGVRGGDYYL